MYPKRGKALSIALSAFIVTSSMPTNLMAQELTGDTRQSVADATPAPAVCFVLHATGSYAWNVADTLTDLLKGEGSVWAPEGAADDADVAEVGFDGLMLAVDGLAGVRYRLIDASGNPSRWGCDGSATKVCGAAAGVEVELGEGVDDLVCYLAACLRSEDGSTSWTPWVSVGESALVQADEGTLLIDIDVCVLRRTDPAPEAKETVGTEDGADAEATAPSHALETQTTDVAADETVVPVEQAPEADAVAELGMSVAPEVALGQEDAAPVVPEATDVPAETGVAGGTTQPEPALPVGADVAIRPQSTLNDAIAAASAGWARLGGTDRFETAALIGRTGFVSSDYAVLTTGRNFPDALSAVSLAGKLECPILICETYGLPSSTVTEIMDLGVKEIYVVGGASAVSDEVIGDLEREGMITHRLEGMDRTETSLAVFREMLTQGPVGSVIVAAGQSFADALSIAPWAWRTKSPILLTDANGRLTSAEVEALAEAGVPNAIIVGGVAAVSDEVEAELSFMNVGRIAGKDRYETSAEVARFEAGSGHSWQIPYVATGKSFPDTLTGSALVGATNSILVLADEVGQVTLDLLAEHTDEIDHGVILGGVDAVPFDDPLAVQEQATATGKVGYQNPEGFYQVSSNNVTITDAAQPPFDYITPSRIKADATREDCVNAFLERAVEYLGTPYVWDYACAPGVGVDCIGLVYQCAYACGMDLGGGMGDFDFNPWAHYATGASGWHSHDSNNFWDYGSAMHVPLDDRQPGDLINYLGHTAIYLGDDQIIHAYTGQGVVYASMWDPGTPRGCIRLFQ